MDSHLIANPAAGGGRVGRMLGDLVPQLERALGGLVVHRTTGPGQCAALAAAAVNAGAKRILSLGGDGTHGEVAGGVVDAQAAPGAVTFVPLPGGTGSDWCRLHAWGGEVREAIPRIAGAETRRVDLGRVSYVTDDGRPESRYFLNIGSAGLGGETDRRLRRSRLGGTFSYARATLEGLLAFTPPKVRIVVDGVDQGVTPIFVVAVANGRYFGGGMLFAPGAKPDDGLLDVVVMPPRSMLRALRGLPGIYSGAHVHAPDVRVHRGRVIELVPVEGTALLDIDGESPGAAPARFDVLPGVLSVAGLLPTLSDLGNRVPDPR